MTDIKDVKKELRNGETEVKEVKEVVTNEEQDDLITKDDLKGKTEELWALKLVTGEELILNGYFTDEKADFGMPEDLQDLTYFRCTGSILRLMANPILVKGNLAFQKQYIPWVHEAHTDRICLRFIISWSNNISKRTRDQFIKTTTGISVHGANELPGGKG